MKIVNPKKIIGKTILTAKIIKPIKRYDDKNHFVLKFSDGSEFVIIADYGAYTGNSSDEYPVSIEIYEK